jgi:hypothetical protein
MIGEKRTLIGGTNAVIIDYKISLVAVQAIIAGLLQYLKSPVDSL